LTTLFCVCSKRIFHASSSSGAQERLCTLSVEGFAAFLQASVAIPYPLAAAQQSGFSSLQTSVFRAPVSAGGFSLDDPMSMAPLSMQHDDEEGSGMRGQRGGDSGLPAGMTTARYLLEAASAQGGAVTVVGKFVGEGDNIGDGLDLLLTLLHAVQPLTALIDPTGQRVYPKALVHPESWGRRYGHGIRDANMFY
jgi:hypothetical protein